jgi:hypothetical protein
MTWIRTRNFSNFSGDMKMQTVVNPTTINMITTVPKLYLFYLLSVLKIIPLSTQKEYNILSQNFEKKKRKYFSYKIKLNGIIIQCIFFI